MSATGCAVDGCDRTKIFARGWCAAHWSRWRRTGSTGAPEVWDRKPQPCMIEGCSKSRKMQGYCLNHGRHIAKGGHPDFVGPIVKFGEDNGSWKGSGVGYTGAHMRVRDARGPASRQSCVDCGERAREWSYNHSDPTELRTPKGMSYSADPSMYEPRCASCHRQFDRAHRQDAAATRACQSTQGGLAAAGRLGAVA